MSNDKTVASEATVVPNDRGGFGILIPPLEVIVGNYATEGDAWRGVDRSGFRRRGSAWGQSGFVPESVRA